MLVPPDLKAVKMMAGKEACCFTGMSKRETYRRAFLLLILIPIHRLSRGRDPVYYRLVFGWRRLGMAAATCVIGKKSVLPI